jgi:hypothetical protein
MTNQFTQALTSIEQGWKKSWFRAFFYFTGLGKLFRNKIPEPYFSLNFFQSYFSSSRFLQ